MLNLMVGLETAIRSLRTYTDAMNTADHNVANLANPDYSRQLANIITTLPLDNMNGAGQIGTGSTVGSIERIRDIYLDRQINAEWQNLGMEEIINRTYQNLKAVFPEAVSGVSGVGGLQAQIDAFWSAWDDVAAQAKLSAAGMTNDLNGAKNRVYTIADGLAQMLNTKANQLTDMQVDLNTDLRQAVQDVNVLSNQIYQLNKQIVFVTISGQTPNDLLDKRDAALTKLSELVNVDVAHRDDGSILVHIHGHTLVNGAQGYNQLTTLGGQKDSKLEDVAIIEYTSSKPGSRIRPTVLNQLGMITGGKIAGILKSRDDIAHWYGVQLDTFANSLITVVNKIHRTGVNSLGVQQDLDFFQGNKASSIAVNQGLLNGQNVAYMKYTDSDIAEILGGLKNKLVSSFVISPSLQAANPANNITSKTLMSKLLGYTPAVGSELVINGIHVAYDTLNMTLGDFIKKINSTSSTISAVFDDTTNEFFMVSNQLLNISDNYTHSAGSNSLLDSNYNLAGDPIGLGLIEEQVSAAPVNYSGSMFTNQVNPNLTWVKQQYQLDWKASDYGTVNIYMEGKTYYVDWKATDAIKVDYGRLAAVDGIAGVAPETSSSGFDNKTQKFYFGTKAGDGGVANVISPFTMTDQQGNATQTMKILGNMRFNEFYPSITGKLEGDTTSASNMLSEYTAAVDQLQGMQDSITQVNENEELARAKMYQRAYDASVRLTAVIDEMLNMLINRTGTSSSANSSS